MPSPFLRFIALFLIPCLLAGNAGGYSHSRLPSPYLHHSVFSRQTLTLKLSSRFVGGQKGAREIFGPAYLRTFREIEQPLAIVVTSWWGRLYEAALHGDAAVRRLLEGAVFREFLMHHYQGAWDAIARGNMTELRTQIELVIAPREETGRFVNLRDLLKRAAQTVKRTEPLTAEIVDAVLTEVFDEFRQAHHHFFIKGSPRIATKEKNPEAHAALMGKIDVLQVNMRALLLNIPSPAHRLFGLELKLVLDAFTEQHVRLNRAAGHGVPLLVADASMMQKGNGRKWTAGQKAVLRYLLTFNSGTMISARLVSAHLGISIQAARDRMYTLLKHQVIEKDGNDAYGLVDRMRAHLEAHPEFFTSFSDETTAAPEATSNSLVAERIAPRPEEHAIIEALRENKWAFEKTADYFGVSLVTLNQWLETTPTFRRVVNKVREMRARQNARWRPLKSVPHLHVSGTDVSTPMGRGRVTKVVDEQVTVLIDGKPHVFNVLTADIKVHVDVPQGTHPLTGHSDRVRSNRGDSLRREVIVITGLAMALNIPYVNVWQVFGSKDFNVRQIDIARLYDRFPFLEQWNKEALLAYYDELKKSPPSDLLLVLEKVIRLQEGQVVGFPPNSTREKIITEEAILELRRIKQSVERYGLEGVSLFPLEDAEHAHYREAVEAVAATHLPLHGDFAAKIKRGVLATYVWDAFSVFWPNIGSLRRVPATFKPIHTSNSAVSGKLSQIVNEVLSVEAQEMLYKHINPRPDLPSYIVVTVRDMIEALQAAVQANGGKPLSEEQLMSVLHNVEAQEDRERVLPTSDNPRMKKQEGLAEHETRQKGLRRAA